MRLASLVLAFVGLSAIGMSGPGGAHAPGRSSGVERGAPARGADLARISGAAGDPGVGSARVEDTTIILELQETAVTPESLFDLEGRTLRFTPQGLGYRVENRALEWDPIFGMPLEGYPSTEVTLSGFEFPFSGDEHASVFVNVFGNLTFGVDQTAVYDIGTDRFAPNRGFGQQLIGRAPMIAPLFRRLGGFFFESDAQNVNRRFAKELGDRLVVTWTISEPYFETFAFTNEPLVNEFQAVLHEDGTIDFSYNDIQVEDAVVGVFPIPELGGDEVLIGELLDGEDLLVPAHLDLLAVRVFQIDGTGFRFEFETRGEPLATGDAAVAGLRYSLNIDIESPFMQTPDVNDVDVVVEILGGVGNTYSGSGPGVLPDVTLVGRTLSIRAVSQDLGDIPALVAFGEAADIQDLGAPPDRTVVGPLEESRVAVPAVDFTSISPSDPALQVRYEEFSYRAIPSTESLACAVIEDIGDQFDMMAFYTDWRIDAPESGAVSTGPIGNEVTGIIAGFVDPQRFCTESLQVAQFPSFIGSPFGAESDTDVWGPFTGYDRQVGLLTHEIGHRWLTVSEALVDGETVRIGDVHWEFGLHTPSVMPLGSTSDNSPMGGAFWVDNGDGTFDKVDNEFFVPATSYSALDLYLMGLMEASEVPDFFLVDNPIEIVAGRYAGDRIDLTVEDVIAANGARQPAFASSQKDFNIGFVGIVEQGQTPSATMSSRLEGIRDAFLDVWPRATANRATLRSDVEQEPDPDPDPDPDGPCESGSTRLCLNQQEYEVEVTWRDFAGNTGVGTVVPGSDDSGLFWFFDENNWEMLVKVLDGCAINGNYWVFAAATTDVEYTLTVTHTASGTSKSYSNPLGTASASVIDVEALPTCAGSVVASERPSRTTWKVAQPVRQRARDQAPVRLDSGGAACQSGDERLCLNASRFAVEMSWRDFQGNTGPGRVVELGSDDSGLFWFFDEDNWEVLVKVLDGCAVNGHFWVFAAATTDVEYTLDVTDSVSGTATSYFNTLGSAAEAVVDVQALAVCD